MRELRIKVTDAIMEMNFTVDPDTYNVLFRNAIKEITNKANKYEQSVLGAVNQ